MVLCFLPALLLSISFSYPFSFPLPAPCSIYLFLTITSEKSPPLSLATSQLSFLPFMPRQADHFSANSLLCSFPSATLPLTTSYFLRLLPDFTKPILSLGPMRSFNSSYFANLIFLHRTRICGHFDSFVP
ncbi:UNVERIFIED_CONTAM: hypothetical protein K2H54_018588 [Gekko kuhli]